MDLNMDPLHLRRANPPREQDMVELHHIFRAFRAVGGAAGNIVLLTTIIFSALSAVAIHYAEVWGHQGLRNYHRIKNMRDLIYYDYICLAYGALAALFVSFITEHIYIYVIIRQEVLSAEHEGPEIRWTRYFLFMVPFYWVSFVVMEISLIIAIIGLHQKMYLKILFRMATYLDILTIVLTTCVHLTAVKIRMCILLRDQINALPELTVESDDFAECEICLDTPAMGDMVRQLPCRHTFHANCVNQWLIENPTCPKCRGKV